MSSLLAARMRSTITGVLVAVVVAGSVSGCAVAIDIPRIPTSSPTQAPSSPRPLPTAAPDDVALDLESGAVVLIVGDSFTEGYGATTPTSSWASIAARTLGWNATIDGVGGTGFTKEVATDGRTGLDFTSRILAHSELGAEYDVVVLQGGLNDSLSAPTIEAQNVRRAVRAAQDAWPAARILVFGPTAPLRSAGYHRIVRAIREPAIEAGAIFIDPDEPRPWINTGNTDLLDAGDGLHVNDAGHGYLAARFAAAVETLRG